MLLLELEAEFRRWEDRSDGSQWIKPPGGDWGDDYPHTVLLPAESLERAQGLVMMCPGCYRKRGRPVGVHLIQVGFANRGLLDHQSSQRTARPGENPMSPRPSRWVATGTGLNDLTLSPSIDCGCWHGHVENGAVRDA